MNSLKIYFKKDNRLQIYKNKPRRSTLKLQTKMNLGINRLIENLKEEIVEKHIKCDEKSVRSDSNGESSIRPSTVMSSNILVRPKDLRDFKNIMPSLEDFSFQQTDH